MNLYNEAMNKRYIEHSAKGQSWGKHKYIAIKNGRYIYPEDVAKGKIGGAKTPEERSRQINDQIKSAHSNATSSKMDLKGTSNLEKQIEATKKRKEEAAAAEKKATETTTSTVSTTTSTTTEEKKSGSGKKGSGGSKKGSSSKKSSSKKTDEKTTQATQQTTAAATPEAQELGFTEEDFKNFGLTEPVQSRDEAIEKLAMKVIHGDFGNGQDRKTKLGKYYTEIQKKVNEIMKKNKSKTTTTQSTEKTVAHSDDYSKDVLMHYGILGMKWGIRRYQPYPEGHSGGKEVGAAKRDRKKLSKEQKDKIKTAAATAGAVATVAGSAAGAAKLYKMDKARTAKTNSLTKDELKEAKTMAGLRRQYNKDQGKSNLEKAQFAVNESNRAINQLKNRNREAMAAERRNKPRMDLSKMTDQEMRNQINRELLERQYNDLFAPSNVDPGKEKVAKILDVGSDVMAITGSALGIAVAIKMLGGKG